MKRNGGNQVDADRELLAMRAKGMSLAEIGKVRGVTKQRIHQQIQGLLELNHKGALKRFREELPAILDAAHAQVLTYIVKPEVLEKASANNLGYLQTQLHTSRRLEEGQSTANVGLHVLIEDLARQARAKSPETLDVVGEAGESKPQGVV